MKIYIKATAHYSNGHIEDFSERTEVSVEEYEIIKQCSEQNHGRLDSLEDQAPELYYSLYELFISDAKAESRSIGSYRPIRMIGGGGNVYRRRPVEFLRMDLSWKEKPNPEDLTKC